MANNRDNFNKNTIRALQDRTGNLCSNPGCRRPTSGPNHVPEKATRIGIAAHITAASAGGPRYDPSLSADQRSSIQNGIWLCSNCSALVDSDPYSYPVDILVAWRHAAETQAREELDGIGRNAALHEQALTWICPHCGTAVVEPRTVCLGCDADVLYGSTQKEWKNAVSVGAMLGGTSIATLMYIIPEWLNTSLLLNIPSGWGLGLFGLLLVAAAGLYTGYLFARQDDRKRRLEPPRFIRKSHW